MKLIVSLLLLININTFSQDWMKDLVVSHYDKFKDVTRNYVFDNITKDNQLEFNLLQIKDTLPLRNYIWIKFRSERLTTIADKNESLILLVDNKKYVFNAEYFKNDISQNNNKFILNSYYSIDDTLISEIVFSKDVQIGFYTDKGINESSFIDRTYKLLKLYWETFFFKQ